MTNIISFGWNQEWTFTRNGLWSEDENLKQAYAKKMIDCNNETCIQVHRAS
jgi:hypothetical protein